MQQRDCRQCSVFGDRRRRGRKDRCSSIDSIPRPVFHSECEGWCRVSYGESTGASSSSSSFSPSIPSSPVRCGGRGDANDLSNYSCREKEKGAEKQRRSNAHGMPQQKTEGGAEGKCESGQGFCCVAIRGVLLCSLFPRPPPCRHRRYHLPLVVCAQQPSSSFPP